MFLDIISLIEFNLLYCTILKDFVKNGSVIFYKSSTSALLLAYAVLLASKKSVLIAFAFEY